MFGSKSKVETVVDNERFQEVSTSTNSDLYGRHLILKDTKTGVLYYMVQARNNGGVGLTPLLNPDGSLIVEPVE